MHFSSARGNFCDNEQHNTIDPHHRAVSFEDGRFNTAPRQQSATAEGGRSDHPNPRRQSGPFY